MSCPMKQALFGVVALATLAAGQNAYAQGCVLIREAARATEHGEGLGDVSAIGRMWVFDPATHSDRNFSVGLGFKAPTGNQNQYDVYNDNSGANPTSKPIDQSIEPGDGGWGAQLEVQGFSRVGRTFVFGSANYLLNPKDVNDAPSGRSAGQYQ